MQKKLIVIGGGAAGFFCAINAARMNPQLKVIILEKSNKLLAKVKISGGGRCNTTHACFDIPDLVNKYPRGKNFVKKAFHWFHTGDAVQWFAERGINLKTEPDGRMFPATNESQTIINCLLQEADKYGVTIQMQCEVKGIEYYNSAFELKTTFGKPQTANYICIACGGYPKANMFDWLTNTGHHIIPPVPSLFTFNIPNNDITQLMGVSVENVSVKIMGSKLSAEGPLLITHWGLSGPAVLKLSAWGARELADAAYQFVIIVNWLPSYKEQDLRNDWPSYRQDYAVYKMSNKNPFGLPNRLWLYLLECSGIVREVKWAETSLKEQNRLISNLTGQQFQVKGKTTFKEEFVTCGGISLSEIDVNTMQSKLVPGLFFAGEVMDVDGITGGFNFQHAWTSGWIAAKSIASL